MRLHDNHRRDEGHGLAANHHAGILGPGSPAPVPPSASRPAAAAGWPVPERPGRSDTDTDTKRHGCHMRAVASL
ncbi:hypothetical protein D0Z66_20845 (plasmid) [Cereibacter sphaeroides]|nr:hypothetical protein D0Z66_20845 [Cereibacter sphaeroides]